MFLTKISNNKVINSGLWFTFSNFLMKSIGFLTTPIFTRMMTKTEFGDFNNIQTWLMILLYITSFNLEASLIRACQEFKQDLNSYVFSMISLSLFSAGIWWLLFLIFNDFFSELLSINSIYINCMFIYLMFCPAVNIFQNAERFKYKYKWTVVTSMIISIGASLLSVVLVIILPNKLYGRVIGYILPTVLIGLSVIIYYILKVKKINFSYWKYALPITLPYIPHLLSMYILSNLDRIMIKKICGAEFVALYSLAYTCGMLITILVTSINNAYSPWLAEKLSQKDYKKIRKISVPYVFAFSYISIATVLIAPELLYIMGGPSYMEAKYVMPPVAAGCLLQFIYCMYVNIEQYEKKTMGMALASGIAAILNILLNFIFINKYGYIAAAYTTYIGYFFLLLMHMYLVKKMSMSHVYNNKKILIMGCCTSLFIFLLNFILNITLIRYSFLIIYLILGLMIVFRLRDKIKTFFL